MLNELFSLFFPQICMACDAPLLKGEKCICIHCRYHLPQTGYHLEKDNPLMQNFWGRVQVHAVAACYFFDKGEKVQRLLHRLKYEGCKEVGIRIGELYGPELKTSALFDTVDLIIPVPLHASKEKKRGYNQSLTFAQGLSKSMEVELDNALLYRTKASSTQTRKSRFSRWENVNSLFRLDPTKDIRNKHILVVDDVITTGATLEACIIELLKTEGVKVSVATIACA